VSRDDNGGAVLRGGPAVVVPGAVSKVATRSLDAAPRIRGLDLARGLAILGMLAAHTLPGDGDAFYDGRSSILFAVLAGVSLGLMTGGEKGLPPERRPRARLSIAIRALLLIALGLTLWLLDTNIAIILDSYGFLFLLCLPLLFARRWLLAVIATACAVLGPHVIAGLITATDATGPVPVTGDSPLSIPLGWLDSYYPAPVWFGYVLVGLLIARAGVSRHRTQLVMIVCGAVTACLGYAVASASGHAVEAHSDTTAEAISSGALAVVVIGLLVAGAALVRSRPARAILFPLQAAGSMPLSIYTAQVLIIALVPLLRQNSDVYAPSEAITLFTCLAVGSLLLATLWRLRFAQGPLEWLFARLSLRRPWRRLRATPIE
jgi:uncharacterized membrane protein YeiB